VPIPTKRVSCLDSLGWAEGFEPSATGTTIRRSTKLSYAHRKERIPVYQGLGAMCKQSR
jgi:hypothetical protein